RTIRSQRLQNSRSGLPPAGANRTPGFTVLQSDEESLVKNHFKPLLREAGLPNIRLYDLRHTSATLALTVGVAPKVVSEQLGHANAAFTLDVYSHVLPHMQDDAAAKVEAALMSV